MLTSGSERPLDRRPERRSSTTTSGLNRLYSLKASLYGYFGRGRRFVKSFASFSGSGPTRDELNCLSHRWWWCSSTPRSASGRQSMSTDCCLVTHHHQPCLKRTWEPPLTPRLLRKDWTLPMGKASPRLGERTIASPGGTLSPKSRLLQVPGDQFVRDGAQWL